MDLLYCFVQLVVLDGITIGGLYSKELAIIAIYNILTNLLIALPMYSIYIIGKLSVHKDL